MPPPEELDWFNAEVRPCEPALRAYLHKRFPALSDHDDLVQEAYARVVHARRAGRITSVKAFLFTVARNLAIDMFRRRQRTPDYEPISETNDLTMLVEPIDTTVSLEYERRLEAVIEAVTLLPERCREVMMLRHLDGMHYIEIAEQLGISPNTVRNHLVKGVKNCSDYLRKRGMFASDSANTSSEGSMS